MPADQFPVGSHITLPVGETREYEWIADRTMYVSLAEFVADTAGVMAALVFKRDDSRVTFPRNPEHGDENPLDDHVNGADGDDLPIEVSTTVGESRYTMLYRMEPREKLAFRLDGSNLSGAADVRFRAAAASTMQAAVGARERGGSR